MGSIEVYDYKQQKWVPYVPDPEKWYQHFKDLRDGYVKPDYKGRYIVGSGAQYRKLKEMEKQQQPVVKLVTPVAQATEIARSEVKRKKEETEHGKKSYKKRKNRSAPLFKSSKPKKANLAHPDLQL